MTYDLLFTKSSASDLQFIVVKNYFLSRPNFEHDEDSDAFAYMNKSTGTHFLFDYLTNTSPNEGQVGFEIAYGRPHTFALEAEIEINNFIKAFNVATIDPQRGTESDEGANYKFVDWFREPAGSQNFIKREFPTESNWVGDLPANLLYIDWVWNYYREQLRDQLGASRISIAQIWYFEEKGKIIRTAVWTNGMPIAIPRVDKVLLVRLQDGGLPSILSLVPYQKLESIFNSFPQRSTSSNLDYRELGYDETPASIKSMLENEAIIDGASLKRVYPDFIEESV